MVFRRAAQIKDWRQAGWFVLDEERADGASRLRSWTLRELE